MMYPSENKLGIVNHTVIIQTTMHFFMQSFIKKHTTK